MDVSFQDTELSWIRDGSYTVTFDPSNFDHVTLFNGKRYILTNCNFGHDFSIGLNAPLQPNSLEENGVDVQVHDLAPSLIYPAVVQDLERFQLYESLDGAHYTMLASAPRNAFPRPVNALVTNRADVATSVASMLDTFFINMIERAPPTPTNVRVHVDFSGCTITWQSSYPCALTFSNHAVSEDVLSTSSPYHFIPKVFGESSVLVNALSNGLESVAAGSGKYVFFKEPDLPTLTAAFVDDAIDVSWGNVESNGVLIQYKLFRSLFSSLSSPQALAFTGRKYRDADLMHGHLYWYFLAVHYSDPNGFVRLPHPAPVVAVARAPIQTFLPLWSDGMSKASAVAILYVSLVDMLTAFEIDLVNHLYYFHVERMQSMLSLNPAFAVVIRGAALTEINGAALNEYQLMAENDYVRFLALQLWGNAALASLFTNIPTVLVDVQTQCAAAMSNVRTVLESIDSGTRTPVSSMVETAKGWAFTATDTSPLNICGVLLDNLQASGRYDETRTTVPFIDGDSLVFEVNFQQTGFISRPYYIQCILKDVVPPQPSTSNKSFLNWI